MEVPGKSAPQLRPGDGVECEHPGSGSHDDGLADQSGRGHVGARRRGGPGVETPQQSSGGQIEGVDDAVLTLYVHRPVLILLTPGAEIVGELPTSCSVISEVW